MIVAVDFDGTCTTHEYPRIGRDIGAVPVLRKLVAADHRIILWTMRSGRELEEALQWFEERKIPLFGVNSCPDQESWTSSPKPFANLYIDDSALGCPLVGPRSPGGRPHVDWEAVDRILHQMLGPSQARAPRGFAGGAGSGGLWADHGSARPPRLGPPGLWLKILAGLAGYFFPSIGLH